jgi:hypothetical protein
VIDYGIRNKEAWEGADKFRIGERVELDHFPLEIIIEETNHKERGKGRAKEGDNKTMG